MADYRDPAGRAGLRRGLAVPCFADDPADLVQLGVGAEQAGLDGYFLWDHLVHSDSGGGAAHCGSVAGPRRGGGPDVADGLGMMITRSPGSSCGSWPRRCRSAGLDLVAEEAPPGRWRALLHDDFTIVAKYQAEYAGLVQYYLLAQDVFRPGRQHWGMETSLLKTLAGKHRLTVRAMARTSPTVDFTRRAELETDQYLRSRASPASPACLMLMADLRERDSSWESRRELKDPDVQV